MATKNKDTLRPAVPQPTKRDRVIAQRQAAAAAGDSIQSIANKNNITEADLLAANPGVVTVRPGQVVNIPPTGGGYMYSPPPVTNPFAGSQAYAGVKVQGSQQPNLANYNSPYNGFQTPTTNGFQANQTQPALRSARANYRPPQQTQSQANFQTPTTNGFSAPAGYTNLTPSQSQNIPQSPAQKPPQTSTSPAPMFPVDDKGKPIPYTGDPNDPNTKLWKDYWNASAEAGVDLSGRTNAPKVMTRSEIWEMKAAQRRRRSAEQPNYSGGFQYDTTLSPLVRNITWGIRG